MAQHNTVEMPRTAQKDAPESHDTDFADGLGLNETQLVEAHLGDGARAITPYPDRLMRVISQLVQVMALARNESALNDRMVTYGDYHGGNHSSMVSGNEIDPPFFLKHWTYVFAIA